MSSQHHGENLRGDSEIVKLFKQQEKGRAVRQWPGGRMGADDDGQLAYAIATDQKNGAIIIDFGKPVHWFGLDLKAAEQLQDQLTERIMALRGITA